MMPYSWRKQTPTKDVWHLKLVMPVSIEDEIATGGRLDEQNDGPPRRTVSDSFNNYTNIETISKGWIS